MKKILPLAFVLLLFLNACDDMDSSDKVKAVDKNGSVEVSLSSAHIDSLKDVITTHYKVWRYGNIISEFDKKDTVRSLGTLNTEGENDNGDTQDVKVKKDYEFFVTIK